MGVRVPRYGVLALAFWSVAAVAGQPPGVAIIVGPTVAEMPLSAGEVERIFERRQQLWPDGQRIHPVNLPPAHPARLQFSTEILGRAPEAMESYWRERYFHGVTPPHVLASEHAVKLFVETTPGAIGYVSDCIPPPPLKVALLIGHLSPCKP